MNSTDPIRFPPTATVWPASPVPLDVHGAVAADAPCVHCGYNLRGLTADGRCPECDRPVLESLKGEMLRFANPVWLGKLCAGLSVLIVADALGLAAGLAQPVFVRVESLGFVPVVLFVVVSVLSMIGVMLVAARPLGFVPVRDSRARCVAHDTAAWLLAGCVLMGALIGLPILRPARTVTIDAALRIVLDVLSAVVTVSYLLYLMSILKRTVRSWVGYLAWPSIVVALVSALGDSVGYLALLVREFRGYRVASVWLALGLAFGLLNALLLLTLALLSRWAVLHEARTTAAWREGEGSVSGLSGAIGAAERARRELAVPLRSAPAQ